MPASSRRTVLTSLAGLPAAGLAGCLTDLSDTGPGTSGPGDGPTPEPVDLDEAATRWAVRFDGPVSEPPTIADGTVHAGTSDSGFGTPEPGSDDAWTLAALSVDDGAPAWSHRLAAPTTGSPVVANGATYVQTGFSTGMTGTKQRLVVVDEGERRWRSDPAGGFNTVLAVADDGRAFVGTSDDAIGPSGKPLFALAGDDGSRAWEVESGDAFGGRLLGAGLLVDLGSVAVEHRSPTDGSKRWQLDGGLMSTGDGSIPVVDGAAFVSRDAPDGETFAAVDLEDGSVRWTFDDAGEPPFVPTGAAVLPELTVGTQHDSLVVGTEYDGALFGLAPVDGGVLWRFEADGDTRDGPVAAGEHVYVGDLQGTVYAVDPTDGSEVWRADAGAPVGSLGVAGDILVVRSGKGSDRLLGLDRADGGKRWVFETTEDLTLPALGDGVVAVGSDDGLVRLLGP